MYTFLKDGLHNIFLRKSSLGNKEVVIIIIIIYQNHFGKKERLRPLF